MNELEHDSATSRPVDEDEDKRRRMEEMVSSYDSYMSEATFGREIELREMTVDLAQVRPGDHVLEVGSGTGALALAAKRRAGPSGKVFGIDTLPGMIEASRRKAEQADADIVFQLGNIDEIPFSDNLFDVVLCSFMIFHMSEDTRQRGVQEIRRVLKSDGRLLILDVACSPQKTSSGMPQEPQHDVGVTVSVLNHCGFSDVELLPIEFKIRGVKRIAAVRAGAGKS